MILAAHFFKKLQKDSVFVYMRMYQRIRDIRENRKKTDNTVFSKVLIKHEKLITEKIVSDFKDTNKKTEDRVAKLNRAVEDASIFDDVKLQEIKSKALKIHDRFFLPPQTYAGSGNNSEYVYIPDLDKYYCSLSDQACFIQEIAQSKMNKAFGTIVTCYVACVTACVAGGICAYKKYKKSFANKNKK